MTSDKDHVQEIARWLGSRNKLLITGHRRPDGDCLGSALALGMALASIGKTCILMSADPVPHIYASLPGAGEIRVGQNIREELDGFIALECGNAERSGLEGLAGVPSLNIDHHGSTVPWADINWIDPSISAVGEMIFMLLESLGIQITPEIATNLFAAIMTDTGSFQYSNTSEHTFRRASRLVSFGASPANISRDIYMNQRSSRLRLLSRVLATLHVDDSEKIADINMTMDDLEASGASVEDTEGFVNYPLSISGIEACAFFRQSGERRFRVSLRSKQRVDVSLIAMQFGGGGHARAAGFSMEKTSLAEARNLVLDTLRKLL